MNFTLPKNIKSLTFALMGVGIVAIAYGFFSDPSRAWASLLVNNFFFLAIAVAGTFFVAVNYVSNAGWAVLLKRIPEAMGGFLPFAGVGMLIIFLAGGHDIYHWTHHDLYDPASEHYDAIIAGKAAYLNTPFYVTRMVIVLGVWILCHWLLRRNSLKADDAPLGEYSHFKKNFKLSAFFLVFFAVTSSTSAWDWIMSIDTHWFSTLFGWYVFSGLFVSGLVTIALITIYLKSKGYLEEVNENHLHDLGKFIFAFSIFWTYLWFSQFMLIWYSNIPEEVTYFMSRFDHYKVLFVTTFAINFIVPVLILMTRDSKRKHGLMAAIGVVLLVGHWLDVFVMVMPGTVGDHGYVGIPEIGMFLGFAGLFIFTVFKTLEKAPLSPRNHPYLEESVHHHI